MKSFIAMLSLLAIFAVQAGTVSPKALAGLESRMDNIEVALESKLDSSNTNDYFQGKIIAGIADTVRTQLATAQKMFNAISSEEDLTEENIAAISEVLDQSEALIQEI